MTIRELLLRRLSRARMMTLFWAVWLASLVLAAALLNPPLGLLMASTVGAMAVVGPRHPVLAQCLNAISGYPDSRTMSHRRCVLCGEVVAAVR